MMIEMKMVAFSSILGLAQIIISSHAASFQRGYKWTAGARDGVVPPLTGVAGRLERAFRNYLETFPIFLAAVFVAHVTGKTSEITSLGAQMYFWGRVVYLPIYASGIYLIRSLIWNVSAVGIMLILFALIQ